MKKLLYTLSVLSAGLSVCTLCAEDYKVDAISGDWTSIAWGPSVPESNAANNITMTHAGGGGNDNIVLNGPLNSDTNSYETGNFTVNLGSADGTIKGLSWSMFFNKAPYVSAANVQDIDVNDPDYASAAPLFKVNGDFTVNVYNTSDNNNGKFSFRSNNNVGGLEITGDLIANVVINEGDAVLSNRHVAFGDQYAETSTRVNVNSNYKLWSFKVGGNVELKNTFLSIATYNGINAEIAGTVNFQEGYNGNVATMFVNTDRYDPTEFTGVAQPTPLQTIKVGGLSSYDEASGTVLKTGLVTNNLGATNAYKGVLEITGSGVYEFGGNTSDNKVANDGAKLSIVMSGSGTQILSGQNDHTGDTVVQNGKLLMATINAESKLIVQGGKFGATGDNALIINNVEWSGGGFSFDLGKENFTLNIGTLSGDFDSTLFGEFEFSNITSGDFLLISLSNENEALAAFNGKTSSYEQDGKLYEAIFSATNTEISVSFSQVPEPATCAAILGALALAFAAYRRKA